jgi:uncharacterized protein (DUF58 family)
MVIADLVPWIIGLFIIAALMRIDIYFSILYVFMGVYLLGRLWTTSSMHQLSARRKFVNRAFPGEEIAVDLIIYNRGWLPIPWLEIHDSLPVEMISPPFYSEAVTLGSREEKRFHYTLSCHKRGYYTIGPLRWHTGDLIGLVPQHSSQIEMEYIIIYPRIVPLEKLGLPTHSPLASIPAPAPLFVDPTRIMGVRNYQIGDSPRRIHWSATARMNTLLVKRYQPAIARETLLCLDLDQENYNIRHRYIATELAILTAASIANHIIIKEGLAVGLAVQAYDPLEERIVKQSSPIQSNRSHLMSILEILARAQGYTQSKSNSETIRPFAEHLRYESLRLSWGSTVVVVTGEERYDLIDSLIFMRQHGLAIALILIMPPPVSTDLQQHVAMLDVPIYRIWREEELENI